MSIPNINAPDSTISSSLAQQEAAAYQQYLADHAKFTFSNDPFEAFFYLIAMQMDVTSLSGMNDSIHGLSQNLEALNWYTMQISKIKQDFVDGKTNPSADKNLRIDIATLINHMVQLPGCVPADGGYIAYNSTNTRRGFKSVLDIIDHNSQPLDPVLGRDRVKQIIETLFSGFDIQANVRDSDGGFIFHNLLFSGKETLAELWKSEPGVIQPYLNAMSTIESTTKGISGAITTQLDYMEKQYMSTLAFLKSMFNYFYQESKAPIGKEEG